MSFLTRHFPFFCLLFFWILFSSPYFLQHSVPYPADQLLNNYAPWSDYGVSLGPVKNPALSDVVTQLFPWKKVAIDAYKAGHLPIWNPYEFSGNPLSGNYQSAVFSPFTILFFLLPFVSAWSLLILLQPLIAGIGMYCFVAQLTKNKYAGLLSSIAFMFSGFITVWMEYGTLSMSASMLPWILLSLEKLQEKKQGWLFLGAGALAVSFLSGHFQTSLYVSAFAAVYMLVFCTKNRRILVNSIVVFIFGLLAALPQIINTIGVFSQTVRSEDVFTDAGIPWWYIITVAVPDFFGNPTKGSEWVGHYAEWASFVGVIPLLFALFAEKDKKHVRFFQIASVVSLVLALKTPILTVLAFSHLPVLSSSYPTRIIVLFSFSVSVLAGFGLVRIWEGILLRKKALVVILSYAAGLVLCWMAGYFLLPHDKTIIALRNLVYPSAYFVLAVLILGIVYQTKHMSIKRGGILICILLAGTQGFFFTRQWNPFTPSQKVYPHLAVIQEIQKNLQGGRVYGTLSNAVYSYYHIPSVEGYDPIYSQRYSDFIRASDPTHNLGLNRSSILLDPHGKNIDKIFNLLGVSVLYHPKSHDFQPWAYPVWEKGNMWQVVYDDDKVRLYKNTQAMQIATLFCSYQVIPEDKKLLSTFYSAEFIYTQQLLLSSHPKKEYGAYCKQGGGKVKSISEKTDTLQIVVETETPALLLITHNYFPTWSATVNGKNTTIYPADLAFMAVEVPAGKSQVVFTQHLF